MGFSTVQTPPVILGGMSGKRSFGAEFPMPNTKKMRRERFTHHQLHEELEKGNYAGSYGWDNAAYISLAERRAGVDLKDHHGKRSEAEVYIKELKELIDNPATREHWHRIVTFDPFGLTASTPSIACTTAKLNMLELTGLEPDGKVVNSDGSVNVTKAAVYYAWNLPELSSRLGFTEKEMRDSLYKFSRDERLNDENIKVYLPPVGGLTVYIFGDARKIRDPLTEIAVRVHDACNGSDVFGTDICTCRPYLIYALKGCVEVAQRGGVGVFVYFRKEGRSLGEVTKFRVYNARKNQEGGDRADKYFFHTERIAGIRDARFQDMMPDVLNWLGIHRIDWLFSMSNEKYDALVGAGIRIYQRVPLPESYVPKGAFVELHAKIADGYHAMDTFEEGQGAVLENVQKLSTIRKQCKRIYELAKQKKTKHFRVVPEKFKVAVSTLVKTIKDRFPDLKVPIHSRFRHFIPEDMESLELSFSHLDKYEKVRRMIDLATVSVIIDAGAGPKWKYTTPTGDQLTRSEGIAAASFQMFCSGLFSSDTAIKTRVNSLGLKALSVRDLSLGFQYSKTNVITGLEGRTGLLRRLGQALEESPQFFGHEVFRPGNVLDYVLRNVKDGKISITVLWKAIIQGFESIWPNHVSGIQRGDVWTYNLLYKEGEVGSDLVPFHKLSQWLILSWLEPLQTLEFEITDLDQLTCLAEYRNGGFLMDTGLLELRHKEDLNRMYNVGSEIVVEWRALTVCLIDEVAKETRKQLGKTEKEFPLAMVLEGGTWMCGRQLAYKLRDGKPPIQLRTDGTVF